MKQYSAARFRMSMRGTLDQCEESCEPVLITTRKDGRDQPQQMIVISKAQYDMMIDKTNGDK